MNKKNTLLNTAFLVTIIIIVGKILGFGREAIIASYYGTTSETDAFFLAQGMPGTIFPAVCNSLSLAFTPLYVESYLKDRKAGDAYASKMLMSTMLLGIFLSILGVWLSPYIVPVFAPGFEGEQLELAISLTRLTMGAFELIMLQYMLCAILNAQKKFIGAQIAALLYNITVIILTIFAGKHMDIKYLTIIVIVGLLVQVLMLILCAKKVFKFNAMTKIFDKDFKILIKLALPILLGNSVVQLNNIVDKALASIQPEGSLSSLNYANTLSMLVISVFVISLSTVLFPTLTIDIANGERGKFRETLDQGIKIIFIILVPITFVTIMDAKEIVSVVYGRGKFGDNSVYLTSLILIFYAPRFVFAGVREVITRAFFAIKDTKTPMICGSIGVGLNIVFSILFVFTMGMPGIALGTSLSSLIIALLLLILGKKKEIIGDALIYLKYLCKLIFAMVISIIFVEVTHNVITLNSNFSILFIDTIISMVVYLSFLVITGNKEITSVVYPIKIKVCNIMKGKRK